MVLLYRICMCVWCSYMMTKKNVSLVTTACQCACGWSNAKRYTSHGTGSSIFYYGLKQYIPHRGACGDRNRLIRGDYTILLIILKTSGISASTWCGLTYRPGRAQRSIPGNNYWCIRRAQIIGFNSRLEHYTAGPPGPHLTAR